MVYAEQEESKKKGRPQQEQKESSHARSGARTSRECGPFAAFN
jgi:hypothetical protein